MNEPYPLQPQVVACQWMSIAKGTIVNCGEMPTKKAENDQWYCKFHFDIGKNFKPFENFEIDKPFESEGGK